MAKNAAVLKYITKPQDATTIAQFMQDNKNLFLSSGLVDETGTVQINRFLQQIGENGKSNYDQIFESLPDNKRDEFYVNYVSGQLFSLFLEEGIELAIPIGDLEKVFITGKNLMTSIYTNNAPFIINTFGTISASLDDPDISGILELRQGDKGGIKIINENIQVWIYSKSLDKIIDVSPFITTLTTTKSDVGTFQFSINPIHNEDNLLLTGNSVSNQFSLDRDKLSDFFNVNLQMNDIVFIRFERLKIEEKYEKTRDFYDLEVNKSELNDNRVFDMIGLIDEVGTIGDFNSTNYDVNISGRDLMKMFIEDGSYFLERTMQSAGGTDYMYGDLSGEDFFSRMEIGGGYNNYFFSELNKGIEDIVGFIFNHLSNLGVVKSDLFQHFSISQRTQKYLIKGSTINAAPVKGIWQIMDVAVDEMTANRTVSDSSLAYPDGTMIQFISKVCHPPFVEWWGDTFYNEFKFIFREPPFTREALATIVNNPINYHTIEDINLFSFNLNWETEFYSWYRFDVPDSLLGTHEEFAAITPVIYFNEFLYYFGNHSKIFVNPYLPRSEDQSPGKVDKYMKHLLRDLLYVIETHIYLPFTRKGAITINGDRKIKKGSWVKLNKTNELFYVEGVTNNAVLSKENCDRTTTLTVKRGMMFDHILGGNKKVYDFKQEGSRLTKKTTSTPNTSGTFRDLWNNETGGYEFPTVEERNIVKYSYFDLVDLELIERNIKSGENIYNGLPTPNKLNVSQKSILNKNVFDYFLKRRQWKE